LVPTLTFEIEATAVPRVKLFVDASSPMTIASASGGISTGRALTAIYPGLVVQPANGRAVIFTTNIRVQLPTPATRVAPFFVAGVGAGNVRRTMDIELPVLVLPPGVTIPISPITQHVITSATDLAFTIGGGVDVRLAAHVAISVDLRYFRLLSERDTNMGRLGAGVRYRF
jgi:opacity protein-like surface antigen